MELNIPTRSGWNNDKVTITLDEQLKATFLEIAAAYRHSASSLGAIFIETCVNEYLRTHGGEVKKKVLHPQFDKAEWQAEQAAKNAL